MNHSQWRWQTAKTIAQAFNDLRFDWAICNGVDVVERRIGRDIDVCISKDDVSRAVTVAARLLRDAGWPSVWYRKPEFAHQVVAFDLQADGPVTLAFDFVGDPDWWSTAGIALASKPMVVEREIHGPFILSPDRAAIKTRIMPFLHDSFDKMLQEGGRSLERAHFELLARYGLTTEGALCRWLDRHSGLFAASATATRHERRAVFGAAARDLRSLLRRQSMLKPPRWIRAYARKLGVYTRSAATFSPISLSVSDFSKALFDEVQQMARGTFIDVLSPHPSWRRMIPKKPVSGFTVHIGPAPSGPRGVTLASDSWGGLWKWKLGRRTLPVWGPPGPPAIFEAVQWILDQLHSAASTIRDYENVTPV